MAHLRTFVRSVAHSRPSPTTHDEEQGSCPEAGASPTGDRCGSAWKNRIRAIAATIDERILGVHMIGELAAEVIHEAAMGMHLQAMIDDFIDLVHVYPTMSEALKIGAQAFRKDVTKLSCCAE